MKLAVLAKDLKRRRVKKMVRRKVLQKLLTVKMKMLMKSRRLKPKSRKVKKKKRLKSHQRLKLPSKKGMVTSPRTNQRVPPVQFLVVARKKREPTP